MFGDAALAAKFADVMLKKGVYVIAFSYPVVPQGKARIRTQISAGHTREDLAFAIETFVEVKKQMSL
jgi:glycine C-acetyltransferase